MDKSADAFLAGMNLRLDALETMLIFILIFLGLLFLSLFIYRMFCWLDDHRPPMATRTPRAERRPDAMKEQMQADYEEASRRG